MGLLALNSLSGVNLPPLCVCPCSVRDVSRASQEFLRCSLHDAVHKFSSYVSQCNDHVPYKEQLKRERTYPAHGSVQGRHNWEQLVAVVVGPGGCLFTS